MEGDEPSPGITCGDSGCRVTRLLKQPQGPGAEQDPHQRKSESRHWHTRAVSAAVKLRPLMHQDVGFLLRKLLCWPRTQRSPCAGRPG